MKKYFLKVTKLEDFCLKLIDAGFDQYSRMDIRYFTDHHTNSITQQADLFLTSKGEDLLEAYGERGTYGIDAVFGYKSFDLKQYQDFPISLLVEIKAAHKLLENKDKIATPFPAPLTDHIMLVSTKDRQHWVEVATTNPYETEFRLKLKEHV